MFMPWTPDDAMHHALETNGDPGDTFTWRSCDDRNTSFTLEMDIPVEAFKESMDRNLVRGGTLAVPSPLLLVDPGDPYVGKVASHILDIVGDSSDRDRATAALNFVQSSIRYVSDEANYGCEEFWATPVETLYLYSGDCEDQAVLLCSIFGAMGLDWAILDYPTHIAVGVRVGDSDGYLFCEATSSVPRELGWMPSELEDQTPETRVPGDHGVLAEGASKGLAWFRYLVEDVTGL